MSERSVTRRERGRPYLPEMLPASVSPREQPPDAVAQLLAAGRMSSSLRRALRSRGIDPRMARLVLCLYGRRQVRPREIAFQASVSPSTASRWLDRAEQLGLVDKFYDEAIDRRATAGRLTGHGRRLRASVEEMLDAAAPYAPTHFGAAFGARNAPPLM